MVLLGASVMMRLKILSRQKHIYQLQSVQNLKKLCKDRNLRGTSRLNKAGLVEKLLEADSFGLDPQRPICLDGAQNEAETPEKAGDYSEDLLEALRQTIERG